MKAHIVTETKTYFNCPNCGAQSNSPIDHIIAYLDNPSYQEAIRVHNRYPSFGPWSCDNCGVGVRGTVYSPTHIELSVSDETITVKTWDLLVLMPQKHPVFFVVDAKDYSRKIGEPVYEGKEYFYNEHTCPTNWITNVIKIINEKDDDPHGLFEYVGSVDQKDATQIPYAGLNPDDDTYPNWEETFPEAFKDKE